MVARKLSEIAAQLGLILQGDDAEVIGVNTLEGAGPDEVSFLANPKYADQLAATRAGAVIVRPEHAGDVRRALISENPYQDFGRWSCSPHRRAAFPESVRWPSFIPMPNSATG